MDDLDRMYRRLVHNIRTGHPDYLSRPFEVSELYQTLVPYRHNRRELEIETNQDYELALMRLLSGERGYLSGDSRMQEALRAVGRELMRNHLKHCAAQAIRAGGSEADATYDELIEMIYKHSR